MYQHNRRLEGMTDISIWECDSVYQSVYQGYRDLEQTFSSADQTSPSLKMYLNQTLKQLVHVKSEQFISIDKKITA